MAEANRLVATLRNQTLGGHLFTPTPLDILLEPPYHSHRMSTKEEVERIELLQGTLDLLILKTLRPEAMHGWAIGKRIQQVSGEVLQVQQGSLYPALHRLERQKWITADWKVSENKQRVRVYRLTATGKKQLESERSRWAQVSDAIAGVLNPGKRESEA